jgi:membrane protein YdbS with pleckstrin-like domain
MFCWGLFWVNMLIVEPIWAIVCFFIPIFIYRYVFLYFDQCKWAVITHVLCVITLMISYLGIIASRGG